MTPKAWMHTKRGYIISGHPTEYGHDPDDWEPLYTLDQVRECVPPNPTPSFPGLASYDEGWDDCRNITLDALDALMKGVE